MNSLKKVEQIIHQKVPKITAQIKPWLLSVVSRPPSLGAR
jgi:hypothetical protein